MTKTNPRGQPRPRSGIGKGTGMLGGQRAGRNVNPCPEGGAGYGRGKGRGAGRNR